VYRVEELVEVMVDVLQVEDKDDQLKEVYRIRAY
jgi:hypothetical protein